MGNDVLDKPMRVRLTSGPDRPVTQEPGCFPALLSFFFFGFAFRGCGGAFNSLRSASSNGMGVRSGLGSFLVMTGV